MRQAKATPQAFDVASALVKSIMSVNGWPLERSCELHEALEREGLYDFERLAKSEESEVFDRLRRAGYAKSDFVVGLVAERIKAAALAFSGAGMAELLELEGNGKLVEADQKLDAVRGIGPHVIQCYRFLREEGA